MSLILTQNGICSDASSHSVRATIAFYFNGGISLDETDWEFINGGTHSARVEKPFNVSFVCRLFSDLLAVPKHPYAAMENWGLSVFVEQKILLDAEVSSSSYQMELTMVVVHEICHQVGAFKHVNQQVNPPKSRLYEQSTLLISVF